ncbi:MAG: CoA transferase [Chloroflexi bacterium]|nr:CoA transferase [Chloroflexota bacterium]
MTGGETTLSPYRVLDLTDERGLLCGMMYGDLGADVIKIEPPGGDPARNIGPFYKNVPHPERSLYWWAYNTSKRGITLDMKNSHGQDTFKRLAKSADFIIESFPPGHLDSLGLGYKALSHINPGIIMVSITPYGQTGPFKDFKASDLTLMAMGGQMYVSGDQDRPPVRISVSQAYHLGSTHAAVGGMIALHHRMKTGEGQHVDVSIEEAVVRIASTDPAFWEYSRTIIPRLGAFRVRGTFMLRDVWPCKDGQVTMRVLGGTFGRLFKPLVDWMDEEGMAGPLKQVNWFNLDMFSVYSEDAVKWQSTFAEFFLKHTKSDIYKQALKRRIPVMPCNTPREICQNEQLAARRYWHKIEHPELGIQVAYPGVHCGLSATPWRISRRAPLIGEHNAEVMAELNASPSDPRAKSSAPGKLDKVGELNKLYEHEEHNGLGEPRTDALEGLKVADITWQLTGPFITKYLGDFGATVVRVESLTKPDITRTSVPYRGEKPAINNCGSFVLFNSSKLSMSLNLTHPRAIEVANKLVAWADVLVTSFAPGVVEKWGLGYEVAKKINPQIIMLSTSVQGQTGPHATHPGFGWNLNGLAGFNNLTGWPDRDCVAPNIAYTDFFAPWFGVTSLMAALDYRRRTGTGQFIDLAQLEAGLSFLTPVLLDYMLNNHEMNRRGNASDRAAPHNAYPCKGHDRWCTIAVYTEEEWRAFCKAMGNPAWTGDPRFSTLANRKANEAELDSLVAEWTINYVAEELMLYLQKHQIAAGVVQSNADYTDNDPQIKHRGFFETVNHPELGDCYHHAWPAHLSKSPHHLKPAPLLGEHTEYVCTQLLGMGDEEFTDFLASGALE